MKTLKLLFLSVTLVAIYTPVINGQVTRSEAERKPKISETTPPPEEPEYRELRCRGSYSMQIKVGEGRSMPGEQLMNMVVIFDPVYKATDDFGSHLRPGQCAFANWTMQGAIPSELHQEIIAYGQIKQRLKGTPVDESPTAAERFPDAQNVPVYLKDSGNYWSFYVKNTGRGYFEATYGRHWKPRRKPTRADAQKGVRIVP